MKTYLRILGFARPVGALAPQYLIYTLLNTAFSIINFAVMIPLLRVLFGTGEIESHTFPEFSYSLGYFKELFYYYFYEIIQSEGRTGALYFLCGLVVTSTILSNVFRFLAALIIGRVNVNVVSNLRNRYYEKILNFDLNFFSSSRKGDLMSRGTADVLQVESCVVTSFSVVLKEPIKIIALFVVLFAMSYKLTLYTLILLPVSGIVISTIVRKLRKSAAGMQNTMGEIGNVLDETIGGIRIVKAFTVEKLFTERFAKKVSEYARLNYKIIKTHNLAPSISEVLGAITLGLLLLIGGQLIFSNESSLDAAGFIGFVVIFSQILAPAKAFSNGFSQINKGIASAERVFKILDENYFIKSNPDAQHFAELKDAIEFKHVSFSYGEKEILTDINFKLEKGKVVALVGPSGGGKSTLADLVPRFYDPKEGAIFFDGIDLKTYDITSIRNGMGIVTQESILFHDTVFNNIAIGKEDATLEEVIKAAQIANAHSFVTKLEKGYDTQIGERGTKLSGGQRQRLSIARAVIKNPPVLILDEATSALDSESEKLVQEAIYNLMKNRTTLVIAHRLSTIQNADEILVIEDGKIIQRGNHASLSEEGGLYKKLTDMQTV